MVKNQGILYISCGVPGSGKSTFLNKIKGENEIIVSRDEIRFSLLKPGENYFAHEEEVFRLFCNKIADYIKQGKNVYADATHLTIMSRNKLLTSVKRRCAPSKICLLLFIIPLKICLERNEYRKGTKAYVPEDKVIQMYSNFNKDTNGYDACFQINENGDIQRII